MEWHAVDGSIVSQEQWAAQSSEPATGLATGLANQPVQELKG